MPTIDLVDMSGDARARGEWFGSTRRAQIRHYLSDWLAALTAAGVTDPTRYVDVMLRETEFMSAIRQYTPDILEEVSGIAAGAGESFNLLVAIQLMDEEWAYRASYLNRHEVHAKCSSLALRVDDCTYIGQNMDLGAYTDGHQVLLRLAPHGDQPGNLIFSLNGMVGLMGVNFLGVGVCVNALPQLPHTSDGLPVAFTLRKLLQAGSAARAAEIARAVPHATGQHYLIADSKAIYSLEASPAGVLEYRPGDPARFLHTNHPLVERSDFLPAGGTYTPNTLARLRSLTRRLMQAPLDLDSIRAALSSFDDPEHPVCRLRNSESRDGPAALASFTTGSMVSLLRQGIPVESWVSAGPPSLTGYTLFPSVAAQPGLSRRL